MKNLTKILTSCLLVASFATSSTLFAKESPDEAGLKTALASYEKIQLSGDMTKTLDYTYPACLKSSLKNQWLLH